MPFTWNPITADFDVIRGIGGGGSGNVIHTDPLDDGFIVVGAGTDFIRIEGNRIESDNTAQWIGGQVFNTTQTAVNYTLLTTDHILGVTDTAVPRTITLPLVPLNSGQVYVVKDESGGAGTNPITINGNGNLIDGSATLNMTANFDAVAMYFDGIQWRVIQSGGAGGSGNVIHVNPLDDGFITVGAGTDFIRITGNRTEANETAQWAGGQVYNLTQVATAYTVLNNDHYIGVTDTTAPRIISLPSAPTNPGQVFIIKDESGGAETNNITVNVDGGGSLIDGQATQIINNDHGAISVYWDGTEYRVVEREIAIEGGSIDQNDVNGLEVVTSGATTIVRLTNRLEGQVTTVGASTETVLTFNLGTTPGCFGVALTISAYSPTTGEGAYYRSFTAWVTDGVTGRVLDDVETVSDEEPTLDKGLITTLVTGNIAEIDVTGKPGININWTVTGLYDFAS